MRQALAVLMNKGTRIVVVFFQGLLADLELETLGADSAVARIDEALVSADQSTNFASLPFLHRLRGDILLKRNPRNTAPAEDAYRTAIAVAEQQAARSPALQASLALANLYQSVGRPAEAKTVLALALEGFGAHAGNARDRGGTGANGAFGVVPLRAEFCRCAATIGRQEF